MLESLEFFLMGAAVVVDSVLLLILFERANRTKTPDWLRWTTLAVWLIHACNFFHLLIRDASGTFWLRLDQLSFIGLSLGFVLLPSAMLHAAIRLHRTGMEAKPEFDKRLLVLYVPTLLIVWGVWLILKSESRVYFDIVKPILIAFMPWLVLSNATASVVFWNLRYKVRLPGATRFFETLAILLFVTTLFSVAYSFTLDNPASELPLRLTTLLLPLIPAILFVWKILRERMLPLIVERAFVYAGLLAIAVLIQRTVVAPLTSAAEKRVRIDWFLVEWIVLFGLVVCIRPLRERARGALRYLLSYDASDIQEATRRLSVQLSQQSESNLSNLAIWFAEKLRDTAHVDCVRLEVSAPFQLVADTTACSNQITSGQANPAVLRELQLEVTNQNGFLRSEEIADQQVARYLQSHNADFIFRLSFQAVEGLLYLGPRARGDRLVGEQMTALAMLGDQFAATLYNRILDNERRALERKSMQQEKLSILGLMAGSIAHEIRNPLSSIRTLSGLMREELSPESEQHADVSMMIAEIDRLTSTTQRLLEFSRPNESVATSVIVDSTVARLLRILEQYARQHAVSLTPELKSGDAAAAAGDASLSEIVFNLVRNAIEAAREVPSGTVKVATFVDGEHIAIVVTDNGRGIAEEIRETMFQPFVTGKLDGTGLGLFAVHERVRELNGSLQCYSPPEGGTVFEVCLPRKISRNDLSKDA